MEIQEQLLSYIWKFQYFDPKNLTTTQGESLTILSPGLRNNHAGPDFLGASIRLGYITWHGHVELHIQSSGWKSHKHHLDPAYDNVILHVVWQDDMPLCRKDGSVLPTLCLEGRVDPALIEQCKRLTQQATTIPCASQLHEVDHIVKIAMLDRVVLQRLYTKKGLVYQLWDYNKGDWEATAYQLLAYNFGFKVNSASMLALIQTLPLKVIKHCRTNLQQLEALLLGQAGLLDVPDGARSTLVDAYQQALRKEYSYVVHKYGLAKVPGYTLDWKFFRLRPANFPTIRLAQLAQLLHQQEHWFYWLIHTPLDTLQANLAVTQSCYWQEHYTFGKLSKGKIPGLGRTSIDNICINTVVPLLVAYSKLQDQPAYLDQALTLLHSLPAEQNTITKHWQGLGMKVESAFDSQALIELFNHFCTPRKCLSCNIGATLLQRAMILPRPHDADLTNG